MNETQGPAMICATSVVKPGRARIGHIGGNITLPRTVEIFTLVAVVGGILVGLTVGAFVPTGGTQKYFMGAIFGGVAGWFIVTFSPMQNESLLTWLGLTVKTLRQQRYVEGRPVVLAVGVSLVERESAGRIRLVRGAIRVPEGTYDDRGVPRSAANRNLPEGAIAAAGAFVTGVRSTMPAAGARAMPTDAEVSASPARRHPVHSQRPAPDVHGGPGPAFEQPTPHGQVPSLDLAAPAADTAPFADPHGGTVLGAQWDPAPTATQPPAATAPAEQPTWAGHHPDIAKLPATPDSMPTHRLGDPGAGPRLRIRETHPSTKPGKPRKLKD